MYLNASTDKIEIALAGSVSLNQMSWNASYHDITVAGMTLPQVGAAGLTNNTSSVILVNAPAAGSARQVTCINVFNNDIVSQRVIINKDVSGTNYILVNLLLAPNDTLTWSKAEGWHLLTQSATPTAVWKTDYDYQITGAKNGINTSYTTSQNYQAGSLQVYMNGLRLTPGALYDYLAVGTNTFTMNYPPSSSDILMAQYITT